MVVKRFVKCASAGATVSRVTCREFSSLKLIRNRAFIWSGLSEIHVPRGVDELCEKWFFWCKNLACVTFSESSSLRLIGKGPFYGTGLSSFHLPESISCTGGASLALHHHPLKDFVISDNNCFFDVFDRLLVSKDQRFCYSCVGDLEEIGMPDSVGELCKEFFFMCRRVSRVKFGESSSLKLIGKSAFRGTDVAEIHIPDRVKELCGECFWDCKSLSRVRFGESHSLKLIGEMAFLWSGVVEIHIPDGLEVVPCDAVPRYT